MLKKNFERRDFIKTLLGGLSMMAIDWSSLPRGSHANTAENQYDVIVIGSGLGGLSCAAAFARQGFKPLVLEKHSQAGGYATTFKRRDFVFDASLHSTALHDRDGVYNLIPGFPEITDVEFVPHSCLYRAIYPDYDLRVPQKDVDGYITMLADLFPDEKAGIEGIIDDMKGLYNDIQKLSNARGQTDMSKFPIDFPYLYKSYNKTWGEVVEARTQNPRLKTIVSALWSYYGLPPSKLSCFYYAIPTVGYLYSGGYYPKGKSQKISDAFVQFIQQRGGVVMLGTKAEEILIADHAAYGVKTADGTQYTAKAIVSNANAIDTFKTMMHENEYLADYFQKMDQYSVSLSSFQVFLGLKKNLIGELGLKDTEIFYETGYDLEAAYQEALNADIEKCGLGVTLYDNLYEGYSPQGKNTLNIITLQGYEHWQQFESDYFKGKKDAYNKEKDRMTDILIQRVENALLPGLSKEIEVKVAATPLTNARYTGNYRGAIYGWDQTVNNSGNNRFDNATPIKNLYLSGAWTKPGHGYGGVLSSGLQCFGRIMADWS